MGNTYSGQETRHEQFLQPNGTSLNTKEIKVAKYRINKFAPCTK